MSTRPFLTAEWRDLIMANYIVDPSLLSMYLPSKTELDFYDGQCYVSLVGFMFRNVRVMGLSIPLHTDFPEINLRFYVRYKSNNEWRRGVVFIKEIVPKRAITLIANTFFGERYVTMPAMHKRKQESGNLTVSCVWKSRNWSELMVIADENKRPLREGSDEEFITQHSWGYTALSRKGRANIMLVIRHGIFTRLSITACNATLVICMAKNSLSLKKKNPYLFFWLRDLP